MINLLISGNPEEWETNIVSLDPERCLKEHITDEIRTHFSALGDLEFAQIKEFPCVFAYEKNIQKDARIGFITDISKRQNSIKIDCRFCKNTIKNKDFISLYEKLDMNKFEENRTHWSIKNVDIKEIIPDFSYENKSTVFISYSWDSEEHKQWVKILANKLREKQIDVTFDDDTNVGDSLNDFMEESIENTERIICICTSNYKKKTKEENCGVWKEYKMIRNSLSKVITILRSGNDNDMPLLLRDGKYVDMRNDDDFESKFKDLLTAIRRK